MPALDGHGGKPGERLQEGQALLAQAALPVPIRLPGENQEQGTDDLVVAVLQRDTANRM